MANLTDFSGEPLFKGDGFRVQTEVDIQSILHEAHGAEAAEPLEDHIELEALALYVVTEARGVPAGEVLQGWLVPRIWHLCWAVSR